MIGNSFSEDSIHYLYNLAESAGIGNILTCNMYIGGCSIDVHCRNAYSGEASYDFQTCENGVWCHNYGKSLEYGIKQADWDYISLQQASGESGIASSYENLQKLMNFITKTAPSGNFKFIWNMTWAYQQDSTHPAFKLYGNNQLTMFDSIVGAVKNKINENDFYKIIPVGTAVQNARTSFLGDTLTRDGFHLSYTIGRYIAGLTMIDKLTDVNIENIGFVPDGINDSIKSVCTESVHNAVKNPFVITPSKYN